MTPRHPASPSASPSPSPAPSPSPVPGPPPGTRTPSALAAAEADVRFAPDAGRPLPRRSAPAAVTGKGNPLAPGIAVGADPSWHLARRAAHAATASLAAQIAAAGPAAWIQAQLAPGRIDGSACEAQVAAACPLALKSPADVKTATGNKPWLAPPHVARATVWRQLTTRRPLLESVVEMWHDHLHIALGSDKISAYVGAYDREVIRAKALGTFADLLYAATTHPAMLRYLDNAGSTKDHPDENLARELLELHTVGVGNHTEADVKATARLLTGFSVDWDKDVARYRPTWHAVGAETVVGRTFANAGADQAAAAATLRALTDHLARHPSTVRRVATRIARRFVADDPPSALIDRLASVYLAEGTAIVPVLRTLFASAEFAGSVGAKWRRPQEFMAAMAAAGSPTYRPPADPSDSWAPLGTYVWVVDTLGHQPLAWPTPDGPKDVGAAWCHPGALLGRWNAAESIAGSWDKTLVLRDWKSVFELSTALTYAEAADRIVFRLTGIHPSAADRDLLARFLARPTGGPDTPAPTAKVSADALKWHVDETVRLAMASPYAAIR